MNAEIFDKSIASIIGKFVNNFEPNSVNNLKYFGQNISLRNDFLFNFSLPFQIESSLIQSLTVNYDPDEKQINFEFEDSKINIQQTDKTNEINPDDDFKSRILNKIASIFSKNAFKNIFVSFKNAEISIELIEFNDPLTFIFPDFSVLIKIGESQEIKIIDMKLVFAESIILNDVSLNVTILNKHNSDMNSLPFSWTGSITAKKCYLNITEINNSLVDILAGFLIDSSNQIKSFLFFFYFILSQMKNSNDANNEFFKNLKPNADSLNIDIEFLEIGIDDFSFCLQNIRFENNKLSIANVCLNSINSCAMKDDIKLDSALINLQKIKYDNENKLEIVCIESPYFKQLNTDYPFLITTKSESDSAIYSNSGLEYSGDIDTFTSILSYIIKFIDLFLMFLQNSNCNVKSKSNMIDFLFFSLKLDEGFNINFSLKMSILLNDNKNCLYQIIGSNVFLSHISSKDPIFTSMNFQIVVDRQLINIFLSPSDFRFSENELFSLVELIKSQTLKYLNSLPKRQLKMSIVSFDMILCKIVNDIKQSFLMVSFRDFLVNSNTERKKTSISLTICPSLRLFNPVTSYFDYLVNPFNMEVMLNYLSSKTHLSINISSTLSINIWPSMIKTLLNYNKSKENIIYGNEAIHISNHLDSPISFTIINPAGELATRTKSFISLKQSISSHSTEKDPSFKNDIASFPVNTRNSKSLSSIMNSENTKKVFILHNKEILELQQANAMTIIQFLDLKTIIPIANLTQPIFLQSDIVIKPSIHEKGGKLIEILSRYEIKNQLPITLKCAIGDIIHPVKPNETLSLNEKQYKEGKFSLYANQNKQNNNIWDISRPFFSFNQIPNFIITKGDISLSVSNVKENLRNYLIVKPLFVVRNLLPFGIICTFVEQERSYIVTVDAGAKSSSNFLLESAPFGIEFTASIYPLGISKSIVTTKIPQIEIVEMNGISFYLKFYLNTDTMQYFFELFASTIIENHTGIPLFFNDGENVYKCSKDNSLFKDIFISLKKNELFPHSNAMSKLEINPEPVANLNQPNNLCTQFYISVSKNGPFILLPKSTQNINLPVTSIDKDNIEVFPIFIETTKLSSSARVYYIYPKLLIHNNLPFDIKMIYNKNCGEFTVKSQEKFIVTKSTPSLIFSISALDYSPVDNFILRNPFSTIFRLADEDSQKIINITISHPIKNSEYIDFVSSEENQIVCKLSEAFLPSPFVIVNNLPNYPIYAQQSENLMPIRVLANSTSLFPFDAPFSEPAIMITISGKSQLVPLHHEIRSTIFPFKIGSEKVFADVVVISKNVLALVIGYHPFAFDQVIESNDPNDMNSNIETSRSSLTISSSSSAMFSGENNPKTTFQCSIHSISISFFTQSLQEFLKLSLFKIKSELSSNAFSFIINSVQLDNQQNSSKKGSIIMKSSSSIEADSESAFESNFHSTTTLTSLNKNFIQLAISYDSNFLNMQVFKLLIQPLDIQFDAYFLSQLISYLKNFKVLKKFILKKIPKATLCLQNLTIHPILMNISCFSSDSQKNAFDLKRNSSFNQDFPRFNKIYSRMKKMFSNEKSCSVGFGSFVCDDMILQIRALLDILKVHYSFFYNNAVSYMWAYNNINQSYNNSKMPNQLDYDLEHESLVILSRFQASAMASEFYKPCDVEFDNVGNKKLLNLQKIDVFPTLAQSLNTVLKYKDNHLIPLEQLPDLSKLNKKVSPRKSFISNKINFLTIEQVNIESLIKKNENEDLIYFLEYCDSMNMVITITHNFVYTYEILRNKNLTKYQISSIDKIVFDESHVIIYFKNTSRWKQSKPISIEFSNFGTAIQMQLILNTLIILHNS